MNSYKDFIDTLSTARARDQIVYHEGFMASERDPFGQSNSPDWAAISEVAWMVGAPKGFVMALMGDEPMKCGGFGAADLTQKRLGGMKYEYRCTMRRALTAAEVGELRALGAATAKETKRVRGLVE